MIFFVALIMIALLGGVNYYLAHSVWRLVNHFIPRFSVWIPFAVFMVLTIFMLLSFFKPFEGMLQWWISVIGTVWMGLTVYLLLFFLISDIISLAVWLCRILSETGMAVFRIGAGITAAVLAVSVSAYGIINARYVKTVKYDISLSDTPSSELTVALISDVHLGAVGSESRLEKIVNEINALKPDIVCIAGDFFDTNFDSVVEPEKAIETLKKIDSAYGVYACLGNHDAGKTLPKMEDFLNRANIRLLKDEYVVINDSLILLGRLDSSPIGGTGDLKRGTIAEALNGADENLPVIVMDHNPMNIDTYRDEADLILSGHTHKGQIFPGSLITDAMYTVDYGYYRSEYGMQAIVTSGAGAWGLPMRVGTDCEVVWIELKV